MRVPRLAHTRRRNRPEGGEYLCIEVKSALLSLLDRDRVMKNQVFPYLKLSGAEHGLLACARLNSEGRPKLDLTLVSADCTPHCDHFEYPFALAHPTPSPPGLLAASYAEWVSDRRPPGGEIPVQYGTPGQKPYGNAPTASQRLELTPLNEDVSMDELQNTRSKIHNLLWGGGGASCARLRVEPASSADT